MKYLLLILLISCSPKIKVPDVRDKAVVDDGWGDVFSIRSFLDDSDSTYYSQAMVGGDFSISDTSGVVAARIDGVWKITNCQRALEVVFKLDSLRCVNNRIENDRRERNQVRENEIKNL